MPRANAVLFQAQLDNDVHGKALAILQKTGETRTAFLKRLVEDEYRRVLIESGESSERNIGINTVELGSVLSALEKAGDDTAALKAGANRMMSMLFIILKENYRMVHLMTKFFTNNSLLSGEQLINLGKEGDASAVDSFKVAVNLLANANVDDVLKVLQKK